jgi:hypothetical protein
MESLASKKFVQRERFSPDTVLFCSRAASAASFGNIRMAGKTIRQITQLLAAVAVVATAFATSQPVTGLIDPGTQSDDVRAQLSITRFTETVAFRIAGTSIAHLQTLDPPRPQPCPGSSSPHTSCMTARQCVMTHEEAANTTLNVVGADDPGTRVAGESRPTRFLAAMAEC